MLRNKYSNPIEILFALLHKNKSDIKSQCTERMLISFNKAFTTAKLSAIIKKFNDNVFILQGQAQKLKAQFDVWDAAATKQIPEKERAEFFNAAENEEFYNKIPGIMLQLSVELEHWQQANIICQNLIGDQVKKLYRDLKQFLPKSVNQPKVYGDSDSEEDEDLELREILTQIHCPLNENMFFKELTSICGVFFELSRNFIIVKDCFQMILGEADKRNMDKRIYNNLLIIAAMANETIPTAKILLKKYQQTFIKFCNEYSAAIMGITIKLGKKLTPPLPSYQLPQLGGLKKNVLSYHKTSKVRFDFKPRIEPVEPVPIIWPTLPQLK